MKLSIAYINDVHGYVELHPELFYEGAKEVIRNAGGYGRIATLIQSIRKNSENTLVFDGGDTFHGTLPIVQSKGEALIPILNALGISAMVGHWDFAYGPEQLEKLAKQLHYPVLGINVYKQDGSLFLPPYLFKEINDVKIAIIGICSNIIDKTMPKQFSEGLKITDGFKELPEYIARVKDEGADIIILLSHNGFPQDYEMLSKISGIDICLSAHTHNRLYEAIPLHGCIMIQCGCHGSFLGHLELDIQDRKITNYTYNLLTVDSLIQPDEEIEKIISGIMKPFHNLKDEPVGETGMMLHRYNSLNSTMDNLLLSAIQSVTQSDVAFSNGWRYGIPIPAGVISRYDLSNIIPMNPEVSIVDITGREIIQMLEANLERTFSVNPLQQMGGYVKRCLGLSAKIRIENPKGHRIQQIFIGDEPIIHDKTYTASFVTVQGVPEEFGENRRSLSIHAVEAMQQYLRHTPFFDTSTDAFSLV